MLPFKKNLPYILSQEVVDLIKKEELPSELQAGLTPSQLELIYKNKWFKMYVPEELRGLNLDLPNVLKLQETLAYWDGSLAWTITLCSGATYFIGFIDPQQHQELFLREDACWGGSGMSSGIADWDGKQYTVNGFWKYATGTYHNTAYTANCLIHENGEPILDETGNTLYKSFYFYPEEVEIIEDWDTMGLRSTASHSFSIQNLKVGEERTYLLQPQHRTIDTVLFKLPFMSFAELTLAANYLGMIKRLVDETQEILSRKTLENMPQDIKEAQVFIQEKSTQFYEMSAVLWEDCKKGTKASTKWIEELHELTHKLVQKGLSFAQLVYIYSGIEGAKNGSTINRVWRNLNTASQHIMFRKKI